MTRPDPTVPPGLPDRFRIVSPLGAGGMGMVFLAQDRELDRRVALKVIHPELASQVADARFARESRVLARLSHPGVVRLLDAGPAGTTRYLAMELLEGASLDSVLADRRPTRGEISDWVVRILEALAYLHGESVLHRDLKPSNVFLDRHRGPVLIDFGLVREPDRGTVLTRVGTVVGTPRYLAPELLRSASWSVASDLFAVGMLAFDCLSDLDPFTGAQRGSAVPLERILSALASGTYRDTMTQGLADHPQVRSLVLRAVDPEPSRRYPDAPAMAEAWRGAHPDLRPGRPAPSAAPPVMTRSSRLPPAVGLWLGIALGTAFCLTLLDGKAGSRAPSPLGAATPVPPSRPVSRPAASPAPDPLAALRLPPGIGADELLARAQNAREEGRTDLARALLERCRTVLASSLPATPEETARRLAPLATGPDQPALDALHRLRISGFAGALLGSLSTPGGPDPTGQPELSGLPPWIRPGEVPPRSARVFRLPLAHRPGLRTRLAGENLVGEILEAEGHLTRRVTWRLDLDEVRRATRAWVGVRSPHLGPGRILEVVVNGKLPVSLPAGADAGGEVFSGIPPWALIEEENAFQVSLRSLVAIRDQLETIEALEVHLEP